MVPPCALRRYWASLPLAGTTVACTIAGRSSEPAGGYARSPNSSIKKVEWSVDGGCNWSESELISPNQEYSWVQFEFNWHATIGEHRLKTRASDETGNCQPDVMPFYNGGYLFYGVHAHPVTVTYKESL